MCFFFPSVSALLQGNQTFNPAPHKLPSQHSNSSPNPRTHIHTHTHRHRRRIHLGKQVKEKKNMLEMREPGLFRLAEQQLKVIPSNKHITPAMENTQTYTKVYTPIQPFVAGQ